MDVFAPKSGDPSSDLGRPLTVALVGNPNCGKTSLSNRLTGVHDSVGNYPRVTVSVQWHEIVHKGRLIRLVDLPGIYSLSSQSAEERLGRDFIQDQRPDIIVNVLDSNSLERGLFLTTQLIEMGRPRVHVLNMADEARRKGLAVDTEALSAMLGGPVVETVATTGEGLGVLLDAVVDLAMRPHPDRPRSITYDPHLEDAIEKVRRLIAELHPCRWEADQSRWLAIKLLEGDDDLLRQEGDHSHLIEMVRRERYDLARNHGEECEIMFAAARYGFIHGLLSEVRHSAPDGAVDDTTRRVDAVLLHRLFGLPIFGALLWLMFKATFVLGAYPVELLDSGVTWFSELMDNFLPPGQVHDLVVNGVVAGVGGTLVFLPNIMILFFFMALFSETGYLARSSFLMDRVMHPFKLHGKAFIPLVLGFDCNVPAIMATRTVESQRARLIAILISPFMSCSARLPVFLLFAGAFFPDAAETVLFGLYLTSILAAMASAVVLSRFVPQEGNESLVMELPPYRLPTLRTVAFHMAERGVNFIKKVGFVVILGSIIVWFLQEFPRDVDLSQDYGARIEALKDEPISQARDEQIASLTSLEKQERLEKSYLGRISIALTPIVAPLGFSWHETTAIMTGIMAKEAVVGSYAVLYVQSRDSGSEGLRAAIAGSMTPLIAIAFMVFLLLYAPCLSTVAAIRHETASWQWAAFSVVYSFALAWGLAYVVVSTGRIFA